ncbi:MAG: hypothetical protein ACFHWX_13385 [Bacteroidota bacterium]
MLSQPKTILASFLLLSNLLLTAQELKDLELAEIRDDAFIFDYRLHRNPAFILRNLATNDSVKDLKPVHLFRGSVIYGGEALTGKYRPQKHYKLDLQVEPYYISRFGDLDDPFKTQLGLGPMLNWTTKWGVYGTFQWLFPIQNDFKIEPGFGQRPGETGIGYSTIMNEKIFVNLFGGTFTNRRYGLSGELILMNLQGRLYSGGGVYYSGPWYYTDDTFIRERLSEWTGYIFLAYRITSQDLLLRLTGEQFLYEDVGVRFEMLRQFGNTDIGFYAQKSKNGENGGIMVTLALWPRKFYNNSWFQFRPPHSFKIQYDLLTATQSGVSLRNQTNFFYDILRFNPNYVKKQIEFLMD